MNRSLAARAPRLMAYSLPLVLFLALVVGAAPPAPTAATPLSTDFTILAMIYSGDSQLHKELKLASDQEKKLKELGDRYRRDTAWGMTGTLEDWQKKREERARTNAKALAEILTPAQMERFKQVILQQRVGGWRERILPRLPEVTQELRLSDKQKERLTDGEKFEDVLSEGQRTKWKALLGEPFTGTLRPLLSPTREAIPAPLPDKLTALLHRCVEQELKLSPKQVGGVTDLRQYWCEATKGYLQRDEDASGSKQQAAEEHLAKTLDLLLTPGQKDRLAQILLQHRLRNQGRDVVLASYDGKQVLELSPAQEQKLREIYEQQGKELRELVLGEAVYDALVEKWEKARVAVNEKLRAVLDAAQQKKLEQQIGVPFEGRLFMGAASRITDSSPELFLSDLEVGALTNEVVRKALKLSPKQEEKLTELSRRHAPSRRPSRLLATWAEQGDADPEQQAREKDAVLNALLLPDQRNRLRQAALQIVAGRGQLGRLTQPEPWQVVEVARELVLTGRQTQKLRDGAPFALILTKEQQAKWKALLGEPLQELQTARNTRRRLSFSAFGLQDRLRYLEQESLQTELKFSEAQRKRLGEIRRQLQHTARESRNWKDPEFEQRSEAAGLALDKALADLLQPAQQKRLQQVLLQQVLEHGQVPTIPMRTIRFGGRGNVLGHCHVGKVLLQTQAIRELDLKQAQQDQVQRLNANSQMIRQLLLRTVWQLHLTQNLLSEFAQQTEKRFLEVLTAEQREKYKSLLGEPFNGEFRFRSGFDFPP